MRPGYGTRLESAQRLIDTHVPVATTELEGRSGRVRLAAYLKPAVLPVEIPNRVRCLVTTFDDRVLVTWDTNGDADCFPGGGAEPGESTAETAAREVWEETGWHIDGANIEVIGWVHLEQLGERDADFRSPHPDGFMTVTRARPSHADERNGDWKDTEGFIVRSEFVALAELPPRIVNDPISTAFLDLTFGDEWRGTTERHSTD